MNSLLYCTGSECFNQYFGAIINTYACIRARPSSRTRFSFVHRKHFLSEILLNVLLFGYVPRIQKSLSSIDAHIQKAYTHDVVGNIMAALAAALDPGIPGSSGEPLPCPLPVGTVCRISGLKNATQYNERDCVVVSYKRLDDRYGVKVVPYRSENLCTVKQLSLNRENLSPAPCPQINVQLNLQEETRCSICSVVLLPYSWIEDEKSQLACCGIWICKMCSQERVDRDANLAARIRAVRQKAEREKEAAGGEQIDPKLYDEFQALLKERNELIQKDGICSSCQNPIPSDNQSIMAFYQTKAEAGDQWAQYVLGSQYRAGKIKGKDFDDKHHLQQDLHLAHYWIYKAALHLNQHQNILHALGCGYWNGHGPDISFEHAHMYLTPAAEAGHAVAMCELADMFEEGKGVDKNADTALSWLSKSAEAGYSFAQCELGAWYENGIGVSIDRDEAMKWWKMSADQQNPMGLTYYATGLMMGSFDNEASAEAAVKEAKECLEKSLALGCDEAQVYLEQLANVKVQPR